MKVNTDGELVLAGPFYSGFLGKLRDGTPVYGDDDRGCIERTVSKLTALRTDTHTPGILLGKIQSGKTKTFLGVTALAFDNSYDIAVILTKPTKALARQTYKRVYREFNDFIESDEVKVHDILELPARLTQFELNQKLIFVVKKQTDNLDRLAEALQRTYPDLASRRILIIDDEADNASIGYVRDKAVGLQLRTIASQIDVLRRALPNASFLQVTATPYSLYLQPEGSPLPNEPLAPVKPRFTELVPVHSDYVGGKFYFQDSGAAKGPAAFVFKPVDSAELSILHSEDRRSFKVEECLYHPKVAGLRQALVTFIVSGCIRRLQDEHAGRRPKRFAFLFHTAAGKASHTWQESVILHFEEKLQFEAAAKSDRLRVLTQAAYDDLSQSLIAAGHDIPSFPLILERVHKALTEGELMITKVNSEAQVTALLDEDGQLKLRTPLNIFIGGQILDRGITISNLIGFYYGRNPNRFQQDTVLQHSRMYGFRSIEDRAVTRFYTAPHIYLAMKRMHEADTALRERIESGSGDQSVYFIEADASGQIVPCGNQKILASNITTLSSGCRVLPVGFQTECKTRLRPITEEIDALLKQAGVLPADGSLPVPAELPIEIAHQVIECIERAFCDFAPGYESTWNCGEYKAILTHLSQQSIDPSKRGKVVMIARADRNLSRQVKSSSHAEFSDAPDTASTDGAIARAAALTIPAVLLLRQNGEEEQGWRGCPFWWPVIVAPLVTRTTLFAHAK